MKKFLTTSIFILFGLIVMAQSKPIALNLSDIANQIEYPEYAKEWCIEGNVYVEFTVSNTGDVKEFEIKEICDPVFRKSVENAVQNLKFIPAIGEDGNTVEGKVTIPFKFRVDLS